MGHYDRYYEEDALRQRELGIAKAEREYQKKLKNIAGHLDFNENEKVILILIAKAQRAGLI